MGKFCEIVFFWLHLDRAAHVTTEILNTKGFTVISSDDVQMNVHVSLLIFASLFETHSDISVCSRAQDHSEDIWK